MATNHPVVERSEYINSDKDFPSRVLDFAMPNLGSVVTLPDFVAVSYSPVRRQSR